MTYKILGYDEDIDKPLTIRQIEAVEMGVNHKQKLEADKLPKTNHKRKVAGRVKAMGKYRKPKPEGQ